MKKQTKCLGLYYKLGFSNPSKSSTKRRNTDIPKYPTNEYKRLRKEL